MCVKTIVDASAFRHLRDETPKSAGDQFRAWIERGSGLIVYSPTNTKYAAELNRYNTVLHLMRDYNQRGLALDIGHQKVETALQAIPPRPIRRSNDAHVLALARATGATVLFACDDPLQQDFADSSVAGKVGKTGRRSVPKVFKHRPGDTTGANDRRAFLARRRCPSQK